MEAEKDRSACPAPMSASKLRYPLRSASRAEKPVVDAPVASSSKRGRPPSCVSKSVDVLNAKAKYVKPPQRVTNSTKRTVNPRPVSRGSITPISETRMKSAGSHGGNDTPLSEISSTRRRKFCVLTSVSYWLTQIKLAESASRHSVSLGFFKLALESGCEPLQRMREELKSYALRHNLVSELADATQDLLQLYDITEDFEKLEISGDASPLNKEAEPTPNEDVERPSAGAGNLKPRSLSSETLNATSPNKKVRGEKKLPPAKKVTSTTKNLVNPVSVKDAKGTNVRRQPSRAVTRNSLNEKITSSTVKSTDDTGDLSSAEISHGDKENIAVSSAEEGTTMEETEAS